MVPDQAECSLGLLLRALFVHGCLSNRDSVCLHDRLSNRLCHLQPAGVDSRLIDKTNGKNCQCWSGFSSPISEYSSTNAISGRFVPEGEPTNDNCRDKCTFNEGTRENGGPFSGSLEDCVEKCNDGTNVGSQYDIRWQLCSCVSASASSPYWHASFYTTFY